MQCCSSLFLSATFCFSHLFTNSIKSPRHLPDSTSSPSAQDAETKTLSCCNLPLMVHPAASRTRILFMNLNESVRFDGPVVRVYHKQTKVTFIRVDLRPAAQRSAVDLHVVSQLMKLQTEISAWNRRAARLSVNTNTI